MARMLKAVSINGVLVATYWHNSQNLRTRKELANTSQATPGNPAVTLYRYDPNGRLTEEIAGSGQWKGQSLLTYVWSDDVPVGNLHAAIWLLP
jgi:hypothetical protein